VRLITTLLLVQLASCAAAGHLYAFDIDTLRQVRSLAAEGAEVLRLRAIGKTSTIYAQTMIENAREQLRDLDDSEKGKNSELSRVIAEIMAALDSNNATELRAIADRLFREAGPHGPSD
jgi:hypothetical protein